MYAAWMPENRSSSFVMTKFGFEGERPVLGDLRGVAYAFRLILLICGRIEE